MALINHRAREIHFKIVYYGPGLGGKTTNLKILHDRLPPERRGKMISIATDHERTLFFDFLPLDLGQVNGFSTRFHLYTVPGQVYYRLSRRAVLQGVDGVVFVADSHPAREEANRESLADLGEHLGTLGLTPIQLARMPRVFQYNKRDLPGALPVERMHALLNPGGALEFESVASDGRGVNDTLKAVCKLVLARLTSEPATESTGPMPILVMRRPGKAQMVKMAAEAAAAEAAAISRSESAAIAAGTMERPAPPVAASAPGASAQAPRPAYPARPMIAPPRPLEPRPAVAQAPAARPMAATTSAPVAAVAAAPTRAPILSPPVAAPTRAPMPSPPIAAPTRAPMPSPPIAAPARAPMPSPPVAAPAPARPAPQSRPLFRWPWPARISSPTVASQAQASAAPSAAPAPVAARPPAPPTPAPATAQPVAAAPAPPPVATPPPAAPHVAPHVASTPSVVAPSVMAPPVVAPSGAAPQPVASRMMWGRPPRPAGRRGGPPFASARPAQTSLAFPQPALAPTPAPANGSPARPDPGRPAAEARPPAPATEPA